MPSGNDSSGGRVVTFPFASTAAIELELKVETNATGGPGIFWANSRVASINANRQNTKNDLLAGKNGVVVVIGSSLGELDHICLHSHTTEKDQGRWQKHSGLASTIGPAVWMPLSGRVKSMKSWVLRGENYHY
jgi:hypothetical protein